MRLIFILLSGIFLTSCSNLMSGRTYLTEMGQDDSSYFDAGSDFPILGGDSGRSWRNDRELRERTPASEYDIAERKSERSLTEELRALEGVQAEHAQMIYEKHRNKLSTTSEKIYFLKLPHSERKQYLESRGFLDSVNSRNFAPHERAGGIRQSDVLFGMSKEDVKESWGRPVRVEIAGNPSYENERWVYNYNGAMKYIYFESGRVEGWE